LLDSFRLPHPHIASGKTDFEDPSFLRGVNRLSFDSTNRLQDKSNKPLGVRETFSWLASRPSERPKGLLTLSFCSL